MKLKVYMFCWLMNLASKSKPLRPKPLSPEPLTLSIKLAQRPYMIVSLGPKALKYESFDGKGISLKPPLRTLKTLTLKPLNPQP